MRFILVPLLQFMCSSYNRNCHYYEMVMIITATVIVIAIYIPDDYSNKCIMMTSITPTAYMAHTEITSLCFF